MANTTNKSILQPANGSYVNTWDVPYNADMTLIAEAMFVARFSTPIIAPIAEQPHRLAA